MATRPPRIADHRYVGDKRTQVVHDLDDTGLEQSVIDELMRSGQFTTFSPDTLPEARNRCYAPARSSRPRRPA